MSVCSSARARVVVCAALMGLASTSACDGAAGADETSDTDGPVDEPAPHCLPPTLAQQSAGGSPQDLSCQHDEALANDLPVCLPRQGTYASAMCGGDVIDEFALDIPYAPAILEFQLDYTPGGPPWQLRGVVDGPESMAFDDLLAPGGKVIWIGDVERLWISLASEGHDPDARYELHVNVRPDPRASAACKSAPVGKPCSFSVMGTDYTGTCQADAGQAWCG